MQGLPMSHFKTLNAFKIYNSFKKKTLILKAMAYKIGRTQTLKILNAQIVRIMSVLKRIAQI